MGRYSASTIALFLDIAGQNQDRMRLIRSKNVQSFLIAGDPMSSFKLKKKSLNTVR